jgi:hypothetical protein
MEKKLIVYLLALCLVFSIGSVQAKIGGNNSSQYGNPGTDKNISTFETKTTDVSEEPGRDVRWIPASEDETTFNLTQEPTPFSDNFTRVNGSFHMNRTDLTTMEVNPLNDTIKAEFNFTDPTGQIEYRVVLKNVTQISEFILNDNYIHGNSSTDTRMEQTAYAYGVVWGVGELYVNGTLVNENRVIKIMASENVRSSDKEGNNLLFDKELPRKGVEIQLLLPDKIVSKNVTMEKEPVPTNYTLPDGQKQSFINVLFGDSQIEGRKINSFNNTNGNMIGT